MGENTENGETRIITVTGHDSSDNDSRNVLKNFACTFEGCDATFSKARKLTNHFRRHTGQRPFVCDAPGCMKTYTNSSHLARHKKVAHESLVEKVVCPYENCGKTISNVSNFKRHCAVKHSVSHCLICSEQFPNKILLKQHLLSHDGSGLFKCYTCSLSFKSQGDFNRHKRSHREYICHCKVRFMQRAQLQAHKKVCFAPSPPLECYHCGKIFYYRTNLGIHIQTIHNKGTEVLHKCPHENCSRRYRYKKNLQHHIRVRHEENGPNERLPCVYGNCHVTFKNKRYLANHIQNIHENAKPKVVKRNTRKDKGTKKNPVIAYASVLSGIPLTPGGHKSVLQGKKITETLNETIENVIIVNVNSTNSEVNNDSLVGKNFNVQTETPNS